MVNLWPGVPVKKLCDKHLNAAINEGLNLLIRYHMAKGHRIDGWINNGCLDILTLPERITELLEESIGRGKTWKYKLTQEDIKLVFEYQSDYISKGLPLNNTEAISNNTNKICSRCIKCRQKIMDLRG